ncbi:MAG: riboflavin synthase, partial [Candidatus Paceibacteria bacterium]
MFTGIVRGTAQIGQIQEAEGGKDFTLELSETVGSLHEGQSVALDGVCLTVAEINGRIVRFRVMNESLSKTTLGAKHENDLVNIEPSLTPTDELGGHLVYGHVDGKGTIQTLEQ